MTTRGGDGSPEASGGGQFLLQLLQKPPQHSPTPPQLPPPPLQPSSSFDPAISYSSDSFYHPPRHHHHNLPFAPHVFFPQNPISNYPGFNQVDQLHQNPIFDRPLNLNIANSFNGNVNESITRRNCGEVEGRRGSNGYGGSHRAVAPPPGFVTKSVNGGDRRSSDQIMDKGKSVVFGREIDTTNKWKYNGGIQNDRGLSSQHYGSRRLHAQGGQGRDKFESGASQKARQRDLVDDLQDRLASVLELVDESGGNTKEMANGSRDKGKTIFARETDSNNKWKYNNGIQNDGGVSSRFNHVPLNDFEESAKIIHAGARQKIGESVNHRQSDLVDNREDHLASVLELVEENEGGTTKEKAKCSRDKDYRTDKRGKWILNQRMRIMKRKTTCRRDIDRLSAPFVAIYESLIPPKEEKEKQEKLLTLLRSLVKKDWPEAQLYVYGSCANSFGFTKSDIDICLVIQNMDIINKSEVLLKLAETLESNNLQNVQALTRARVPIVKLMDPDTGISCDICINNILAVVNTKLLRDYARIDGRLRQLAFIVKHWAKTRGVNETYQGTLSSYAYVLMCISFLQQRKPAILPCLQKMEATYSVTVENTECAYFSEVDKLNGFGARNGETISHLVWAFFNYWAYYHDYTNDVISVRTGGLLSKEAKDWTRRIGNDRHLICIEDPFEITHDLGRVVDKSSIRVLREEFERAADIMQHDSDPCRSLFEPYVPH